MDDSFDLVSSLQTLPETNPVEVDDIQPGLLGGGGGGGGGCGLLSIL